MKRLSLFTLLLLIGFCLPLQAQIRWNQRWQDYIDRYKDIAIVEMHKYGIPASITLAQGLLESGAGTSELATKGNNHFGIKSHGWGGRTMRHDDDRRGELFRVYDSPLESYEDHSKFLANRAHYKSLFTLDKTDYKGWAHGLKRAGYATNPKYAYRLIDIIEAYRLYEHDKASPIVRHDPNRDLAVTQGNPINKPDFSRVNVHRILKYNDNFYVVAARATPMPLSARRWISARAIGEVQRPRGESEVEGWRGGLALQEAEARPEVALQEAAVLPSQGRHQFLSGLPDVWHPAQATETDESATCLARLQSACGRPGAHLLSQKGLAPSADATGSAIKTTEDNKDNRRQ